MSCEWKIDYQWGIAPISGPPVYSCIESKDDDVCDCGTCCSTCGCTCEVQELDCDVCGNDYHTGACT